MQFWILIAPQTAKIFIRHFGFQFSRALASNVGVSVFEPKCLIERRPNKQNDEQGYV